jgi:hypothetical protein
MRSAAWGGHDLAPWPTHQRRRIGDDRLHVPPLDEPTAQFAVVEHDARAWKVSNNQPVTLLLTRNASSAARRSLMS